MRTADAGADRETGESNHFEGPVIALIATLLAIGGGLVFFAFYGALNADEGFYGLAARAVYEGVMPYRDFGYTQTPLMPYINGALLRVIGFGFLEQRLLNVFWSLSAVGIGTGLLWHKSGRSAALVFGLLMASSLGWLSFCAKGKTYALTGLLLLLMGLVGVYARNWLIRGLGVLIFGLLAVGCRLPVAPVVGFAVLGLMMEDRSGPKAAVLFAFGLLFTAGIFLPFFLEDRSNFLFWNLGFHLQSESVRDLAYRIHGLIGIAFPLWLLGMGTLALTLRRFAPRSFRSWLAVGVLVAFLLNLGSIQGYGEYAVPFVPLMAFLVSGPLTLWLEDGRKQIRLGLFSVTLLSGFVFLPPLDFGVRSDIALMAELLRQTVPITSPIVCSMPVVALESGHPVSRKLLMGKFAVSEDYEPDEAERLGLMTPMGLVEVFSPDECGAVVLSTHLKWNFAWSNPSYRLISEEGSRTISDALESSFEATFQTDAFVAYLPKGWLDADR